MPDKKEHSRTPLFWVITFLMAVASGVVVNKITGSSSASSPAQQVTGKTEQVPETKEIKPAQTETVPEVKYNKPAKKENEVQDSPADADEVKNIVAAWINCTENRDYDCFKSYLSPNYTYDAEDGTHRDYNSRLLKLVQIFADNNTISIRHGDIIINVLGDNSVSARYYQQYFSDTHNDSGYKTLYLEKENGSWKIYRETFSSRPG